MNNTNDIKPFIFIKKLNDNNKIIPLNMTKNTMGPTRHFPVATKEWFNSIYAYNNNSMKNLSIANKNLSNLIKSYFNFYFSKEVIKSKRVSNRFRRLFINKIFVSKAELKHTSSKVTIVLHVYNEERRIILRKIKNLESLLFPSLKLSYKNNKILSVKQKLSIIRNSEESITLVNKLKELRSYLFSQIVVEQRNLLNINTLKDRNEKTLAIKNLSEQLINLVNTTTICENDLASNKYYNDIYKDFLSKSVLEKEIMTIAYYKLLLKLNKSKFENKFLSKLKPLIEKIYNKEVEFKIINLKTLYFNSDIFTQVISLKLKNRNNRLLKVLRSSLYMVKLPKVNRIREKYYKINVKELWVNRVNNLAIYPSYKKDKLNQLLLDIFHNSSFTKKVKASNDKNLIRSNLLNFVLEGLKYKNMAGARLEAKGRLTRRLTASRSVFKIRWKGSLKNIDSSYRGLSSVILRGHVKPNVQYSIINSKTRNGAFGLKGWISSK